jgi:hypothetical protein
MPLQQLWRHPSCEASSVQWAVGFSGTMHLDAFWHRVETLTAEATLPWWHRRPDQSVRAEIVCQLCPDEQLELRRSLGRTVRT